MSNRRRRKQQKKPPSPTGMGWELSQVFFGLGTMPLSDAVISRLVAKGWSRFELEKFRSYGAVYSLQRDSIVFPLEDMF
jgi:hypothetical protein